MNTIHPDLIAIRSHAFLRREIESRLRYMGFDPDNAMALVPMQVFWRALEGTVLALPTGPTEDTKYLLSLIEKEKTK